MSRGGGGMSGANNIPLGSRATTGGGSLAAAASSLSGVSLLNPSYLAKEDMPSSGGRRSKFGPPVDGIGPPPVIDDFGTDDEPSRKRPNMSVINSINAALKGRSSGDNSAESREERRKKRKSRWGGDEGGEKTFIPGMPTMMPQGLSKDQEEAYLRKSLDLLPIFKSPFPKCL